MSVPSRPLLVKILRDPEAANRQLPTIMTAGSRSGIQFLRGNIFSKINCFDLESWKIAIHVQIVEMTMR